MNADGWLEMQRRIPPEPVPTFCSLAFRPADRLSGPVEARGQLAFLWLNAISVMYVTVYVMTCKRNYRRAAAAPV
jgi:hypothetical protein